MQLTLQIISHHAGSMGKNASKVFGEDGGTIGRVQGKSNQWVLPDVNPAEPIVSRLHSVFRFTGGAFTLEDVSVNGTFLNDDPEVLKARNEPVILKSGDRITIGEYLIYVNVSESQVSKEPSQLQSNAAINSFLQNVGVDIPPAQVPPPPIPPSPVPQFSTPVPGKAPTDPSGIGPVDPLALLGGKIVQPASQPVTFSDHSSPISDNFRLEPAFSAQPGSGPVFGTQPAPGPVFGAQPAPGPVFGTQPGPAPGFGAQPGPVFGAQSGTSAGMDWFGGGQEASVPQEPPAQPPVPKTTAIATGAAEAPVASRAAEMGAESVYSALMPLIIKGMMDVLKSRSEIKNQFRVDMTMMAPSGNNPLKFSPSADVAMGHLFNGSQTGFLRAQEAFEEGFNDIKAHELAMMAGVRAAFDHMLVQFSPDVLEKDFESSGKRSGLLGMGGKSRYWEMYCAFFERTTRDSDDNFRRLFGEKFAAAYDEQMQHLTRRSKR